MPTSPLLRPSEITPESLFRRRRQLIVALGLGAIGASTRLSAAVDTPAGTRLDARRGSPFDAPDKPSRYDTITTYNNFYEFGPDKADPAKLAPHRLKTRPWTIAVDGAVKTPRTFDIDAVRRMGALEERIYRHRCVEGWSMVVPWVGLPLATFIKHCEPTGNARHVEFWSLADPAQMPAVRLPLLEWPYREGLRLDEALHPLTFLALGLYGEVLPSQNGAPVRLVVPWKYGFKGAKSIVRIRFVETAPVTTWMKADRDEYGFYANVNPSVDHPRWSQARERRLGEFFKRETLMFNGYADQVAGLYRGMDLRKQF